MAEEKARAEAALDAILDDAIAEFEEEEDLSQKPEDPSGRATCKGKCRCTIPKGSLRVDKALAATRTGAVRRVQHSR